jgi:hypothetical protein
MYKKMLLLGCFAAVCWALALGAERAEAQGYFPAWGGYGYGINGTYSQMPYYSMFPPVYYKRPTARTYGYSPFAYPPGYISPGPQVVSSRALIVPNPYYSSSVVTEQSPAGLSVAPAPEVILNPLAR